MTYYLQSDDGTLMPSSQKPIIKFAEHLPVATYKPAVVPMNGAAVTVLRPTDELVVNEKEYGDGPKKIERVLKAYEKMNRSLGVILSGPKGIGKSMFSRKLAIAAMHEAGLPVIVVDSYVRDIADLLESIGDECLVLFDEFDKTYPSNRYDDDDSDESGSAQQKLLSLFDGISSKKKLYVVTCNQLYGLSDLIVNRPGRFHYHIRFNYPDSEQVTQYMLDNLDEEAQTQIPDVVRFSNVTELNYDQLRAIAFELNLGGEFADIIDDLNILNQNVSYTVAVEDTEGNVDTQYLDYNELFKNEVVEVTVQDAAQRSRDHFCKPVVTFNQSDLRLMDDGDLSTTKVRLKEQCKECLQQAADPDVKFTEKDLFKPAKVTIRRPTDYKSYSYNH